MLKKRFCLLVLCVLILGGVLSGGFSSAAVAQEKEIYMMIANWSGDAFWIDAREGLEEVGKLLGVDTRFTGPLDSDLTKQIADMDTAIAIGVKGIIIPPVDPEALVPAINRAVEAGIPVVTFLNDAPNSKRL